MTSMMILFDIIRELPAIKFLASTMFLRITYTRLLVCYWNCILIIIIQAQPWIGNLEGWHYIIWTKVEQRYLALPGMVFLVHLKLEFQTSHTAKWILNYLVKKMKFLCQIIYFLFCCRGCFFQNNRLILEWWTPHWNRLYL